MLRVSTPAMICALMLSFGLASLPAAEAGPPTDQLRDGIERIFKTLGDPEMSGEAKAAQRRATEIFDFTEMSKRTLGQHERRRSARTSPASSPS